MKIAVEGCAHGDLDNIYATLQHLERIEKIKIDLLICCGDFQALRNEDDLESLACPVKYRAMGSFWRYYSGEEKAPVPTLFIGGNHEASNYLWELYYGGFVAPNIYFLGFAGVVQFGGVRIAGLSGIFKDHDYRKGHFEQAPYNASDIRSIYHVREYDVLKLLQLENSVDIFLSHDWPRGITQYGNVQQLLQQKPYFQKEVEQNELGSKPGEQLLQKLKPSYWFSAHLHVKFAALVNHGNRATKFLALDKCLPSRNFLQVIDVPAAAKSLEFTYDEEWLAITRAYQPFLPLSRRPAQLPREPVHLETHRQWVQKQLAEMGASIPSQFTMTVPPYNPHQPRRSGSQPQAHIRNPQTQAFLQLLELSYLLDHSHPVPNQAAMQPSVGQSMADPDEITLNDEGSEDEANDELVPDDIDELEAAAHLDLKDPDEIPLAENDEDWDSANS